MSLDRRWIALRDAINTCVGYRVLDDDDVLESGDETVCASTLYSGNEDWHRMRRSDFGELFGRTVAEANSSAVNDEVDVGERLFRRRISR